MPKCQKTFPPGIITRPAASGWRTASFASCSSWWWGMRNRIRPTWEIFCLAVHRGEPLLDAYRQAFPGTIGKPNKQVSKYAHKLHIKPGIKKRLAELTQFNAAVAIKEVGDHRSRIILELARIAFVTIDDVIKWDKDDLGADHVTLIAQDRVHPDVKAAIRSVKQMSTGMQVTMHDKLPALKLLGEYYGMWGAEDAERGDVNITQNNTYVDAPPRETFEEWTARRNRELGVETPARATNGSDPAKDRP